MGNQAIRRLNLFPTAENPVSANRLKTFPTDRLFQYTKRKWKARPFVQYFHSVFSFPRKVAVLAVERPPYFLLPLYTFHGTGNKAPKINRLIGLEFTSESA